jgi:diguanylate cyclase (GGDEF)-like protein
MTEVPPDLFAAESGALLRARAAHALEAGQADHRQVLGELIVHYERLMRETRRLIGRSDRAERDMQQMNRELHQLALQLQYRATHDPLTGVLNRGALIDHAGKVLGEGPAALVVLDIDHFKRINDDYGHPAGDAVICAVVDCLKALVPAPAAIGRVGGEEFSIVWPGLTPEGTARLAQRLCRAVRALRHGAPVGRPVTASVGAGWFARGTAFGAAYGTADAALYRAKRDGRDRVRLAEGQGAPDPGHGDPA